jgi:hypothetical protein
MAYLTAAVESLVKKGLKNAMKSKKRKRYDSSSNSDSEWGIGSHDMELVVDKHLKLDKPFTSDLQSTQPRPIKVTDSISNSRRADVKALENAKMEKVTTVVAVMHLYGDTMNKLISDNAKISAKKTKLESKSKNLDLKRSKIGLEEAKPPPIVLKLSPMGISNETHYLKFPSSRVP